MATEAATESSEHSLDGVLLVNSNMWSTVGPYQITCDNQEGNAGDHRLKVQNGAVSCDGVRDSQNIKFKMYLAAFPSGSQKDIVFMLECDGGDSKGRMVCLKNDKVYTKPRTVNYTKWEEAEPEVLFKKIPRAAGGVFSIFESYHSSGQYLAFDASGKVIVPSKADINKPESWFFIYPIQSD